MYCQYVLSITIKFTQSHQSEKIVGPLYKLLIKENNVEYLYYNVVMSLMLM